MSESDFSDAREFGMQRLTQLRRQRSHFSEVRRSMTLPQSSGNSAMEERLRIRRWPHLSRCEQVQVPPKTVFWRSWISCLAFAHPIFASGVSNLETGERSGL